MKHIDYTENDWKLFKKQIIGWQEAYIDKLNHEYIDLLCGDIQASEKFWKLESRINRDKKKLGVRIEMTQSKLISNIVTLLHERIITFDDLENFSEDLKDSTLCTIIKHHIIAMTCKQLYGAFSYRR